MTANSVFVLLLGRAERGDLLAMFEVAECYAGGDGVVRSAIRAAHWYQRAAKRGDVDAMLEIARYYCLGLGVVQDIAMAQHWLKEAYKSDNLSRNSITKSTHTREDVARLIMRFE